jgi:hypothetical protein
MTDSDNDTEAYHLKFAPIMMAIGHVAHHWSRLEYAINQMIWAMSAVSPADGACITAQIPSIVPRLRALIALANNHGASKSLIKDLNRFVSKADAIARRRNRAIHDPWFFREVSLKDMTVIEFGRLEITADKRLTYEVKSQTVKEVLKIAHDIIAAHKEFMSLRERLWNELKERLELRLGKSLADFLDFPGLSNDIEPRQDPPQSSPQ